ncbi:MAG: hypothetical protein QOG82_82 [Actinomycetota bacterium]|jgi:GNAT superfamily N-acetyltransferase|nr:hypothetical protein [Actinomycetota bacterium]
MPSAAGFGDHGAMVAVRGTEDGAEAWRAAADYLLSEPVRHSVFLTLVREGTGRFWWAVDDDGCVVGFAMQVPTGFSAGLTPCPPPVVDALCDAILADCPDLPGVISEATGAAWFAGRWAERRAVPARPTEAQRVYALDRLVAPAAPAGSGGGRLRLADDADRPTMVRWAHGFAHDVDFMPEDPERVVDRHLARRRLWVWEVDGEPVAMASSSEAMAGVCRIGSVYTPPDRRRRGYATACVAALSERLLATGADRCMLYAQLHNPTSNGIYRRMGYEPVSDIVFYRFGGA